MRLTQAFLYGGIFTIFGSSIYGLLGMVNTLAQRGSMSAFFGDWLVSSIVCFGLFTFIIYELLGLFEDLNKRPDDRGREQSRPSDENSAQDSSQRKPPEL